jgi:hypothetical protein
MGTITDIFSAQASDAAMYRAVRFAEILTKGNSFVALQVRGVTPIELGILWALLEKKRLSAKRHALVLVEQVALDDPGLPKPVRQMVRIFLKLLSLGRRGKSVQDESVLLRFPEEFVGLLSKISAASLPDVAERWRRALERRKVAQWSNSFAIRALRGIASRAAKVRSSGPQLFLWVSP